MFKPEELVPCSHEPELWFQTSKAAVEAAKDLCATCVFREPCLRDALEYESLASGQRAGIFGGYTPQERIQLQAVTV